MGKVRTETVKRAARAMLEKFPDMVGTDFEQNKKASTGILEAGSKKLRNRIVGYATRLKRVELKRTEVADKGDVEGSPIE